MKSEKLEKKADYEFLKYLIAKNGGNLSEATRVCKTTYPTFMRKTPFRKQSAAWESFCSRARSISESEL